MFILSGKDISSNKVAHEGSLRSTEKLVSSHVQISESNTVPVLDEKDKDQ